MIEKIANRIVSYQINAKLIAEDEKNIYQYGYIVLIEYCINVIAAVLIAVLFHAYWIMIIFSLTYILLRSYAGGYHAKTSFGCFCMSACMFILVIFLVRGLVRIPGMEWLLLSEIVMLPYIWGKVPVQ